MGWTPARRLSSALLFQRCRGHRGALKRLPGGACYASGAGRRPATVLLCRTGCLLRCFLCPSLPTIPSSSTGCGRRLRCAAAAVPWNVSGLYGGDSCGASASGLKRAIELFHNAGDGVREGAVLYSRTALCLRVTFRVCDAATRAGMRREDGENAKRSGRRSHAGRGDA